jgi:hypothetical protein
VSLVVGVAIGMAIENFKHSGAPAAIGAAPTPSVSASAPDSSASASAPATAAKPIKSVVLQTSGMGAKTTRTFTVSADWSVRYSYDCGGSASATNFSIIQHGSAIPVPIVSTTGTKGSHTAYQHQDGGQLALEINSACDWTVTVTSGDSG